MLKFHSCLSTMKRSSFYDPFSLKGNKLISYFVRFSLTFFLDNKTTTFQYTFLLYTDPILSLSTHTERERFTTFLNNIQNIIEDFHWMFWISSWSFFSSSERKKRENKTLELDINYCPMNGMLSAYVVGWHRIQFERQQQTHFRTPSIYTRKQCAANWINRTQVNFNKFCVKSKENKKKKLNEKPKPKILYTDFNGKFSFSLRISFIRPKRWMSTIEQECKSIVKKKYTKDCNIILICISNNNRWLERSSTLSMLLLSSFVFFGSFFNRVAWMSLQIETYMCISCCCCLNTLTRNWTLFLLDNLLC